SSQLSLALPVPTSAQPAVRSCAESFGIRCCDLPTADRGRHRRLVHLRPHSGDGDPPCGAVGLLCITDLFATTDPGAVKRATGFRYASQADFTHSTFTYRGTGTQPPWRPHVSCECGHFSHASCPQPGDCRIVCQSSHGS